MDFDKLVATVKVRSIPTNIQFGPVLQLMADIDEAYNRLVRFHGDLVLRNIQSRLTTEEKVYYDAWVKNLQENSTYDEEHEEE